MVFLRPMSSTGDLGSGVSAGSSSAVGMLS